MIFTKIDNPIGSTSWENCYPVGTEYYVLLFKTDSNMTTYNQMREILSRAFATGVNFTPVGFDNYDHNTWYYRSTSHSLEIYLTNNKQLQFLTLSLPRVTVI